MLIIKILSTLHLSYDIRGPRWETTATRNAGVTLRETHVFSQSDMPRQLMLSPHLEEVRFTAGVEIFSMRGTSFWHSDVDGVLQISLH